MKFALYNPYLDTLGGGERYTLSIVDFFLQKDWEVDLFWDKAATLVEAEKRFGFNLKKIKLQPRFFRLFSSRQRIIAKYKASQKYDVFLFVSDGSVPWLFAKKNILLFQAPFTHPKRKIIDKIKLDRIDQIICYSQFVKKIIDKEFGIDAFVLAPFVAEEFKSGSKKNLIVSVGRFDNLLHSKRQDILIDAFIRINKKGIKDWNLYLIGGVLHGNEWVEKLKKKTKGLPIKIITNALFNDLIKVYGQAKVYWHAAGFKVDEEKEPEKMEHFGLTTLEAMKSGAVPIVFGGGGQKEIVDHQKNGFLWKTEEDLVNYTLRVIEDNKLYSRLAKKAQQRAKDFSQEKFYQVLENLLARK